MSTVLLRVTCAACEATHDVWAEELGEEMGPDAYDLDSDDLRCPRCDLTAPAEIELAEPLA